MSRTEWIREVLVKQIAETYQPWKNARLIDCDVEFIEGGKDNFASTTYCITIHLQCDKDDADSYQSHTLFTKFMVDEVAYKRVLQSEKQFHNEITWYTTVVPRFKSLTEDSEIIKWKVREIFPECYYACYDADNAVVALEDLRPKKFHLGDRRCLEIKYLEQALKAIARTHAMAYRWRHVDENSFVEVAKTFKEATLNDAVEETMKVCNERILSALEKCPEYTERVQKFREATAEPQKLMKQLVYPDGPLATLCHGDFCRNNVLFSDSSENENSVIDVKLIDFQTARYASPAIDLSFFFFLSTTPQLRAAEFDRLFELYHNNLLKELKAISHKEKPETIANLESVFSLQAFKDDFAKHAIYGYFIMAFFLPIMMVDDETRNEITRLYENNDDRQLEMYTDLGGEVVTSELVESLKEILDRGYWPPLVK